jgi:Leucine-rich repeat (LRR) protein
MPLLETLVISGLWITDESMKNLPLLRRLNIYNTNITSRGIKFLPHLRTLKVNKMNITDYWLKCLPNLRKLYVNSYCETKTTKTTKTNITDEGLKYLPNLRELIIKNTKVIGSCLGHLTQLKKLSIDIHVDDNMLKQLPMLEHLYALGKKVTCEGLKYLPLLETLYISETKIEPTDIKQYFPSLKNATINGSYHCMQLHAD